MVYKILANTLFMGKKLVYVPECHSTNTLAGELVDRHAALDGTLVITDSQTKGKGQRGNTWMAEPGLNFTFSLILKPSYLKASQQFFLNMSISLGIIKYLSKYVGDSSVKWPNDIMINDKKVCGILIENQLQQDQIATTIVGIGLNMNQERFEYPHATSLRNATNLLYNLEDELEPLVSSIESYYLLLRQGNFNELQESYLKHLFRKGEAHSFRVNDDVCKGRIQGVDHGGHLVVEIGGTIRKFGLKEIEYVL